MAAMTEPLCLERGNLLSSVRYMQTAENGVVKILNLIALLMHWLVVVFFIFC